MFNEIPKIAEGQSLADWKKKQEGIKEHGERLHLEFDVKLKKQRMRYHKLRVFRDPIRKTWAKLLCRLFGHELNYDYTNLWCPRCAMALEEIYRMDGVNFYVAMNQVYSVSTVNSAAQYVDYHLANKLRNMGFMEPCDAYYDAHDRNIHTDGFADNSPGTHRIAAPTIQAAFSWLEHVHKDHRYVPVTKSKSWTTKCNNCGMNGINAPDEYRCGNCGSNNTITFRMEVKDNAQ